MTNSAGINDQIKYLEFDLKETEKKIRKSELLATFAGSEYDFTLRAHQIGLLAALQTLHGIVAEAAGSKINKVEHARIAARYAARLEKIRPFYIEALRKE